MIVSKELVISNRKKADIVEELRQKQFRPFPKATKAKTTTAGEAEDAEDNDDDEATATGASTDYDYLLSMTISSLTKEKVRMRGSMRFVCM